MKRTQDEPEAPMPDPTVMFGAMEVNPRQPPLKRLMMEHLQGEQLRKVQSMGNLRGGDAAPAICRVVEGVPREPVLPNANGYTSDTAVPTTSARQRNTAPMRGVPWTEEEHRLFLLGLQKLGKGDWRGISRHYVLSRNPTQVASHAQKYFIRQSNLNKRKRRSSLFDIVSDVGPAPGQAGHVPTAKPPDAAGGGPSRPGLPPSGAVGTPAAARGRGKGAANAAAATLSVAGVGDIKPVSASPPLTAEGAAAMAAAASQQQLPFYQFHHSMGLSSMPQFTPNAHSQFAHNQFALPWGYPAMGMLPYALPSLPHRMGATVEQALSANPKLCKPTATLATPSNWPLRYPFPGIPEHEAETGTASTWVRVKLEGDGQLVSPRITFEQRGGAGNLDSHPLGDDGAACGSPTALSLRRSLDEVRRSLSLDEGNRLSRQGSLGPDEGNAIRRSLDEGNRPLAIAPG